jgi:hypothetical protein
MSFKDAYSHEKTLAEEGNWVEVAEGSFVKIRRPQSEFALRVLDRLNKPTEGLRGKMIPTSVKKKINTRFIAEGILADWDCPDLKAEFGDYSPDQAVMAFDRYPDFMTDVYARADELSNFKIANEVTRAKN